MAKKPTSKDSPPAQPDPQAKLQEAQARLKAATDRQAAVISVVSRLGVSAQDKRLAQAEGKKVEHELREARRSLQDAQALAGKQ